MSGYVTCRSCSGIGKKYVTRSGKHGIYTKEFSCNVCAGTGINQRVYSVNCQKCYAEIVYPRDATYPPKYCRSCKAQIQTEKELKAAEWKTRSCKSCGTEIKYNVNWSKIPDTCKSCIDREKAKWKTTTCKHCSASIKYNTDWTRIPDACRPCVEKERAKWKSVRCRWCNSEFKVNSDWDNKPDLCKGCQAKINAGREEKATIWRRFRTRHDPIDKLPTQVIWSRHDPIGASHHMTIKYTDGYRVSWEATRYGDYGFHWTNENERGPRRHEPPDDATVR